MRAAFKHCQLLIPCTSTTGPRNAHLRKLGWPGVCELGAAVVLGSIAALPAPLGAVTAAILGERLARSDYGLPPAPPSTHQIESLLRDNSLQWREAETQAHVHTIARSPIIRSEGGVDWRGHSSPLLLNCVQ